MIWPRPNDAVIKAKMRRGASGASSLAACETKRGDGDEGAAEQQAAEQWPDDAAEGHAGGDADHFDEAAQRIGRVKPDPGGDLLPEPDGGKAGKAGDHPYHGLEDAAAATLPHDGDQERRGHHIAEAKQAIGDDDLHQRPVFRQRRLADGLAVGERAFDRPAAPRPRSRQPK